MTDEALSARLGSKQSSIQLTIRRKLYGMHDSYGMRNRSSNASSNRECSFPFRSWGIHDNHRGRCSPAPAWLITSTLTFHVLYISQAQEEGKTHLIAPMAGRKSCHFSVNGPRKEKKRPRILGQSDCQEKDKFQIILFFYINWEYLCPSVLFMLHLLCGLDKSIKWLLRRNKINSACIDYSLWWNLRMQLP